MLDRSSLQSPIEPLREPVFRMLWITWLMANVCMWMNDVAAAWMMSSLTTKPIWVALVQTASTLPVFLLGLPSGALADNIDKKRYFLVTQLWISVVAAFMSAMVFFGAMSPALLLLLTFSNGVGLAMRWPVFSAIVPELVPKTQLPAALALNGVSMNASRIIGPLLAGALIASLGSEWVFLFNAVLSLCAAIIISRWKRESMPNPLGRERLTSAMRVGLQYVAQSYHIKGVLLRICIFFFYSTALISLLALLARRIEGGSAATFTLLLASMGIGAIASTAPLPWLRKRYSRDGLVLRGALLQSVSMIVIAETQQIWLTVPAMFFAGAAWITAANTLSVSIQMGLPNWVRARGMSIFQMAIMGASASGAAIWGQVATWADLSTSMVIAAMTGAICMALAIRWRPDTGYTDDLTPQRTFTPPITEQTPKLGQVCVMIEYLVDTAKAQEFRNLMHTESRSSRLRHGALSWELLHDLNAPGKFIEVIVDESWIDHLRRFDRLTTAEVTLRDRKLQFHIDSVPPRVSRYVMESTLKNAGRS